MDDRENIDRELAVAIRKAFPDDGNCPKCGSYHPPDPDHAWLDARDAEFDDRWNARMNP